MNRRTFTNLAGVAAACAALQAQVPLAGARTNSKASQADVERAMKKAMSNPQKRHIAMLLYPDMYPLDMFGPYAFLSGIPGVEVHFVWKTMDPITAGKNLKLTPTTSLSDCPKDLEVIFVPGGSGTEPMMRDAEVLDFLADRGSRAKYVTSVCTGSLVLGAAGLLKGYRATSHWSTRELLPLLGAIPVEQRIVEDRNRITGGGVTSGIDFGLLLASRMTDPTFAEMLQLVNEYDPQPPFKCGTPSQAGPAMTAAMRNMGTALQKALTATAIGSQRRIGL